MQKYDFRNKIILIMEMEMDGKKGGKEMKAKRASGNAPALASWERFYNLEKWEDEE